MFVEELRLGGDGVEKDGGVLSRGIGGEAEFREDGVGDIARLSLDDGLFEDDEGVWACDFGDSGFSARGELGEYFGGFGGGG